MNRSTFIKSAGLSGIASMLPMKHLQDLHKYAEDLHNSDRMPVLCLGHGSPMNAIEENQFVQGFRKVAKEIPEPKAILCISAHWYIRGTKVTAMPMPRTIHDFGGFPEALYQVEYPAPGDPDLAKSIKEGLAPIAVELDHAWGLDHGAWSVIKHLYPDATIPVIQMSIDYTKPPQYHFDLAGNLTKLRDKGILIIGSGNIVHNLRMVDFHGLNKIDYGYDWAREARSVINSKMMNGDFNALVSYNKMNQAVHMAVPTPDHYLPLIYALGLKSSKEPLRLFNDEMVGGSISMTSVRIG